MPGNGDKEIPLKILNSHNPLAPLPLQEILHRLCPLWWPLPCHGLQNSGLVHLLCWSWPHLHYGPPSSPLILHNTHNPPNFERMFLTPEFLPPPEWNPEFATAYVFNRYMYKNIFKNVNQRGKIWRGTGPHRKFCDLLKKPTIFHPPPTKKKFLWLCMKNKSYVLCGYSYPAW